MEELLEGMQPLHKKTICLAFIAATIRMVLRSTFVIITEDPHGIALICSALLAIPLLLHLNKNGGCTAIFLLFVVEPFFSTIYFFCIFFVFNTNDICHELGDDFCENIDLE